MVATRKRKLDKSVSSLVPRMSMWHCPSLLQSTPAAGIYAAPVPAAVDGYILPAANPLATAAAVDEWDRQTDGSTVFYAGSVTIITWVFTARAVLAHYTLSSRVCVVLSRADRHCVKMAKHV